MLPVMPTVGFAPEGGTVGRMLADARVQAEWDTRRANRPGFVSGQLWRRDHDAAVQVLRSVDPDTPLYDLFCLLLLPCPLTLLLILFVSGGLRACVRACVRMCACVRM